jgi:copper transport protein
LVVRCAQAREALSAWYDEEPCDVDKAGVAAHVGVCAACATYRRGLDRIEVLANPATPPPELTGLTGTLVAHAHEHFPRAPMSRRTRVTLVGLAALVVVALVVLTAAHASAHAGLRGSDPAPDSVLASSPSTVELTFTEAVTLTPDSLRVFGPDGERVDDGGVGHLHDDAATLAVGLPDGLPDGTYLVSYRVVSADSHPIGGAYTFSVGHPSATPVPGSGSDAAVGGSDAVDVALGISRWLGYAGSSLGLGGLAFLVWCWPGGWASRRARGLVVAGVVSLVVATLVALLLKGPYDEGSGLGGVTDWPLLRQVLATTYGQALDARLLLLAALVLLVTYRDQLPRQVVAVAPAVLLAGVGVTFALCGHAAAGSHRPLAVASDTVHVAAMSLWLGGLVMLLSTVLVGREREAATPVVLRFSTLATGAVTALVVTGTYQTLREVRSWDVLLHTHYGHVLVVKLGIVGLTLVAAAGSRAWVWQTENPVVPVHAATSAPPAASDEVDGRPQLRRLRLSVAVESVLLVGVLVVTSLLVTSDPARSTEPLGPVAKTLTVGPDRVRVSVVTRGPRRVEVTLAVTDSSGRPSEPKEVDASLTLTAAKIGPLPITLDKTGRGGRTGHVTVPLPGDWRLAVTVRTSAIDEATAYVEVPVE